MARSYDGNAMVSNHGRWLLSRVAQGLVALCIPVFLITTSVRWAVNEPRLYDYGFGKYQVSRVTGLALEELRRAAQELRGYFDDPEEYVNIQVHRDGALVSLFNQREVLHLRDVKELLGRVYLVQQAALLVLLAGLALALIRRSTEWWRSLATAKLLGCGFTVGLLALAGAAVLADFEGLWLQFHFLSFSNTLWMLDPSRDALIQMFPQGFWFDATVLVAAATVLQALLLGGAAWAGRGWGGRRTFRVAPSSAYHKSQT